MLEELSELWAGRSVGLLGGSFNPAHAGHLHISQEAVERLGLDAIWWLVSPQNPLKSTDDMASFEERFKSAEEITKDYSNIIPMDIERGMNTCYTAETLSILKKTCQQTKFIWLMGRDNLEQIHKWKNWQDIFKTMPIAVLDRDTSAESAKNCQVYRYFVDSKVSEEQASTLKDMTAPSWVLLHTPLHPLSSTAIREQK